MYKKVEVNKLVVMTLQSNGCLTARGIFDELKRTTPQIARDGFKSFVQIINDIPQVDAREVNKNQPNVYSLKKQK